MLKNLKINQRKLGQYPLFRLGLKELSMMLEFSVRNIYVIKNNYVKIISILILIFFYYCIEYIVQVKCLGLEICCVLLFYLFFCLCILLVVKWRAYIWKLVVTFLFLLFLLMKTLCLGFTDFCIVLKTKERSQVPLLLEYLPPWFWIYHYYSWHRQFVQGL